MIKHLLLTVVCLLALAACGAGPSPADSPPPGTVGGY
jgi:hypothetical protein